ncbi:MAG: hypothetical protein BWY67_02316 [Bacteroidetes bacterium ADurb.Bin397]|nr:MAG: hypothetical protein BWY67_02316 [Bacteroidetes bacterium ADurb.Bin397]
MGTSTDFWPFKIVAVEGSIISVGSLLIIFTTRFPTVPVFLVIISFPAFSLPSKIETGFTTAVNAGPSLSAITRVLIATPPFSGVELQPHELR